jgi:hypothetical protein
MEAEIKALSACCRELFPIIDMVRLLAKATNFPIGNITMNVSIHEDNSGALVLAQTLPPQFTPRSKYYTIKTIWFREEIFKRNIQLNKSTQSNNWETSSQKVSQGLFLNISKRRSWNGNSRHSLIRIRASNILEMVWTSLNHGDGSQSCDGQDIFQNGMVMSGRVDWISKRSR